MATNNTTVLSSGAPARSQRPVAGQPTSLSFGDRPPYALLRLREVVSLVGLKRSTIYALAAQGKFPAPVKLAARASAWRLADLINWLDDVAKRRFKEGRSEVLVCTDAAAEGLNFQFCGALVNYDMPWNPMRVEQRIGRIDRLGQRFSDIRIINLHYEDTVEADVYRALRSRISIFEKVVGGLQPILTRLPRLIEESVLSKSSGPEAKRDDALQALDNAISLGEGSALNLDDFADEDLEIPPRPDPAITLSDLRAVLDRPMLLPLGTEAVHLSDKDYRLVDGYLPHAVRVTIDREFYEMHSDSVEFWTPGSPTFPDLAPMRRDS